MNFDLMVVNKRKHLFSSSKHKDFGLNAIHLMFESVPRWRYSNLNYHYMLCQGDETPRTEEMLIRWCRRSLDGEIPRSNSM